ncbi:3-phosphoshikimate 1-carboxyvinyltransferase [Chlamydiifrater phoenicopteri]|uniref:3-phosphoshikimate 1-carboxyvinyltransferase n=1 Tax=Chlamydiifrater phoenicopteri TaxID=2681469 RepID=UPI001BCD77B8|nr:3-phosphoshikimate 1-carboxyvinyltransferase [Chlamydiifrater phoenicopteri]
MKYVVNPSTVSGETLAPPSKSHTLRAILFASLAHGTSTITNPLMSSDTEAMTDACKKLGAFLEIQQNHLVIHGNPQKFFNKPALINVGNSGITLRFLTAIAALSKYPITFTGDPFIRRRPMNPLLHSLQSAGAQINLGADTRKLFSISNLNTSSKINFSVDGSDSQFVSAYLIMLPLRKQDSTLSVLRPGELPWVNLTLDWLKKLEIKITTNDSRTLFTIPGSQRYRPFSYSVPGDFSSAAFLLGAILLAGDKTNSSVIHNLNLEDPQGDKKLFHLLQTAGADINFKKHSVFASSKQTWSGFSIDVNPFIDAVPILSVLALFAKTPSRIYNAGVAKTKECDRLECTAKELKKMGAKIFVRNNDELIIYPSKLKGTHVYSHNDHRLAMALTVAALKAKGSTVIHQSECVKKTFPNFLENLSKIGVTLHEES